MFARLLQRDFDGYFGGLADTQDDFWFFLHIPKTAGSSFWSEFNERLQPTLNIEINFSPEVPPEVSRRQGIDELLAARETQGVRAARAHVMCCDLEPLLRSIPRARLVTMLRSPVERMISDFRYSRTPAHPPYLRVIAKYPTLEDYVEDPNQQDKMVRYLQREKDEPISAIRDRLLEQFAFVGFAEFYPICRRVVGRLLGNGKGPTRRLRATESRPENEVQLDAALRRRIERLNERDQELFVLLSDAFRPIRGPLRSWLDAHPV